MEVLDNYPSELLIDGDFVPSESGDTFQTFDPATEEPLRTVAEGRKADVDSAVSAAKSAFEGPWSERAPEERGRVLTRIATEIRKRADDLARIESLDVGKPLSEARSDIETAARYFEYYAGVTDKIHGDSIPLEDEYVDFTVREPLGVTGHIVPWNFPLQILSRSVAPSLAVGNTCVVKPAEQTPLTALVLGYLGLEAGLPSGALNVIPGFGETAGAALSEHSDVNGLTFTGSVPTGKQVGQAGMENLVPVNLELGGKSPLVVDEDVDLDHAVENVLTALFTTNSGQVCSAGSRVIVHQHVYDEFIDQLVDRVEDLEIGPGLEDPDMGPIITSDQLDGIERYIEIGRTEVGEPVTGGDVLEREGNFVEPTVFTDVDNGTRLAQEEIFGPVLCVMSYADEDEAIALANDTQYGLVAGIFTNDLGLAHRFARDVEAGHVYVNEWFSTGVETPFGGYKNSGLGREKGLEALDEFTQKKNVCIRVDL